MALLFISCNSTSFTNLFSGVYSTSAEELASEYYDIANAYYDLKKYDKAIEYYEKTQALLTEENLTITYNLARIYALQNNWSQAESYYERVFALDQNNTSIGMPYAYVLAKQGKAMEASAVYRGFYERNPADKNLLANYILVLLELDSDETAANMLEELKILDPDSDEVKKVEEAINKKAQSKIPEEVAESDSPEQE
ncbi:MAG: tetratricopeptide repeat protein [Treponemataceae bacterium]|nr:tetratricopeptide repeat protein [Treponemataceae bacterium]